MNNHKQWAMDSDFCYKSLLTEWLMRRTFRFFCLQALVNFLLGSWNSEFPFYMILLSFIKFSTIFLVNASASKSMVWCAKRWIYYVGDPTTPLPLSSCLLHSLISPLSNKQQSSRQTARRGAFLKRGDLWSFDSRSSSYSAWWIQSESPQSRQQ